MGLKMPECLKRRYGILIICSSFILTFLQAGMLYSFGVTFSVLQEEFNISSTVTSWIGSINYAMLCGANPISLRLIDRYGHRYMMLVGVFLTGGGILVASFAPHAAVLFLSFNLLFGYGCNVVYNASMGVVSLWYPGTKSSRAFSLTLVAAPIGYLTTNPILELLIMKYGWRISFRFISGIFLTMGLSCVFIIRTPDAENGYGEKADVEASNLLTEKCDPSEKPDQTTITSEKCDRTTEMSEPNEGPENQEGKEQQLQVPKDPKRRYSDEKRLITYNSENKNVLKSPMMWLWIIENTTIYLGLITPYIHLVNFLQMKGVSATYGALAVTIIGVAEMCTRLSSGLLATAFKFHLMHYYPIATAMLAAGSFYLPSVTSFNRVIIYALVTGAAAGPICVSSYLISRDLFPDSFQISWSCTGFGQMIGSLLGPPLAGAIVDLTGSYEIAFYMTGCLFLFCTLLSTIKSIAYRNMKLQQPLNIGMIYKMSPACIESQLIVTERVSVV